MYGDWDRYDDIEVGDNIDVLNEWKWQQGWQPDSFELTAGLDKETAQKEFIAAAEKMGIPPVHWERPISYTLSWINSLTWRESDDKPDTVSITTREKPKLVARTSVPTISGGSADNNLRGSPSEIGALLDGLARLFTSIGSSWQKSGDSKNGKRFHGREWNVVM